MKGDECNDCYYRFKCLSSGRNICEFNCVQCKHDSWGVVCKGVFGALFDDEKCEHFEPRSNFGDVI